MENLKPLSRRSVLEMLTAAVVPLGGHGRIRPAVPAPDIAVVCQDEQEMRLPQLLKGNATALQLMFTECRTTCPMQGAIFEQVQKTIPNMAGRKLRMVSLSVDPANDTPAAITNWLRRFHAGASWVGAAPASKELSLMKEFFGQGKTATDDHTTQINIFNREAELIWRTIELPSAEEISAILIKLGQQLT